MRVIGNTPQNKVLLMEFNVAIELGKWRQIWLNVKCLTSLRVIMTQETRKSHQPQFQGQKVYHILQRGVVLTLSEQRNDHPPRKKKNENRCICQNLLFIPLQNPDMNGQKSYQLTPCNGVSGKCQCGYECCMFRVQCIRCQGNLKYVC